ncbi:ATP-binding protein, partial [archaeon AH-315-M20]|nr:ATP-binding protein [archaeon AH-315-M20]
MINSKMGDLWESSVYTADGSLEELMDFSERKFFAHDAGHVLVDVGVFSPYRGRPSSRSFFEELEGAKVKDASIEKDGSSYMVTEGNSKIIFESEEKARNYIKTIKLLLTFRELYNEKTLINALENWHQNFVAGDDSYYLLFAYIPDKLGLDTGTFEMSDITSAIQGTLTNQFFAFTQAEKQYRVDIESVGGQGIYTDTPGLVFSWAYNLAKNAMKRAEELYLKQRSFKGGNVRMVVDQTDQDIYIAVAQSFDGIDLKDYARLGHEIVRANHELASQIPLETRKRYERWIASKFGEGFGDMKIEDITNLAFLANVSGARISSKTSGIGLYAAQQLVKEKGGKISYFFNPNQNAHNYGEGFLIRLPKTEMKLAA